MPLCWHQEDTIVQQIKNYQDGFCFCSFFFNLLFINMFQKWVKTVCIIVNPSILSIITDVSKMNFKIDFSGKNQYTL